MILVIRHVICFCHYLPAPMRGQAGSDEQHSYILNEINRPFLLLFLSPPQPSRPDAIRQAIVYKLVPGLYEKEILKRQEFYRAHPEDAKLATPEQRGEDTENLIFSPNENISLSIEYADIEYVALHYILLHSPSCQNQENGWPGSSPLI